MKKSDLQQIKYGQAKMRAARGPGVLLTVTSRGTGYRVNTLSENQTTTSAASKGPRWQ